MTNHNNNSNRLILMLLVIHLSDSNVSVSRLKRWYETNYGGGYEQCTVKTHSSAHFQTFWGSAQLPNFIVLQLTLVLNTDWVPFS